MRCAASRPTSSWTLGADAATVWKLRGSTRITRDGSEARNPTGNTVPSAIGTSPKMSPGSRLPTIRSTPSTIWTTSMHPSNRPNSARSEPCCAAYSPVVSAMSAAARASCVRSSSPSSAKIVMR